MIVIPTAIPPNFPICLKKKGTCVIFTYQKRNHGIFIAVFGNGTEA